MVALAAGFALSAFLAPSAQGARTSATGATNVCVIKSGRDKGEIRLVGKRGS